MKKLTTRKQSDANTTVDGELVEALKAANSTAFKLLEEVETLESQVTALLDLMWDLGCFDGCFTDKPSVTEVLSMNPEEFRK